MLKKRNRFQLSLLNYVLALCLVLITGCSSDDNPTPDEQGQPDPEEVVIENPLPVFSITTNGAQIVDEPKIAADFTITEKEEMCFNSWQ